MSGNALDILVLEDNPVQRALYEKILRAVGHEVTAIGEPLDLVNNLDALPVPDAIVLDILMPGMDGVTVLQHLERNARWCLAPVLMMTSTPTKDRVVAANALPVPPEGFLAKPVEPSALLQLLNAIIVSQEPVYLLRHLQRKRLSLKLGSRAAAEKLAAAIHNNKDVQSNYEKMLADARREIQSLRSARAQLKAAPPETLLALEQQIQKLEETCLQHRAGAQQAEAQHKEIIQQRQGILYNQKSLRDIELRIAALTQVLKRAPVPLHPGEPSGAQEIPIPSDKNLGSSPSSDPPDSTGTEG